VALGLATFALGTDTAGSGRVPAAFNNIVGIKPTKGRLSARGVVPACRTLDSVSIFSLNTADGKTVFEAAQGFDRSDPVSRKSEIPRKRLEKDGFVFGVPRRSQLEFFGNAVYEAEFEKSLRRIESCGGRRMEVDFSPFLDAARLLYEGPWVAERYAAVGRFIEAAAPGQILPVIKTIIGGGKDLTAHEAFQSMYRLMALKQAADEVMDTVDFLVTPTAGTCYTIDAVNDDPVSLNSNLGYYTNYMNLLDYCAVAVPMTLPKPVPFGITLAGPAFSDETLMGFASMLHNAAGIPMGKTADFPETIGGNCSPPPERPVKLAVCGAHLKGLELHHQLVTADAVFLEKRPRRPATQCSPLKCRNPSSPGF
jgi:allophanate hydrolase